MTGHADFFRIDLGIGFKIIYEYAYARFAKKYPLMTIMTGTGFLAFAGSLSVAKILGRFLTLGYRETSIHPMSSFCLYGRFAWMSTVERTENVTLGSTLSGGIFPHRASWTSLRISGLRFFHHCFAVVIRVPSFAFNKSMGVYVPALKESGAGKIPLEKSE